MNIYIGNLSYAINEDELKETFATYGEVSSVNLISDRVTGRSKGFGFVEMPNDAEAENAINELNGKDIKDRNVKVNQARPRGERSDRPRRRPSY